MSDLEAPHQADTSSRSSSCLIPRQRISAYHDMPYALFRYDPEDEFDLRKQVTLLETRLSQKGKRVKSDLARGVPGRGNALTAAARGVVRRRSANRASRRLSRPFMRSCPSTRRSLTSSPRACRRTPTRCATSSSFCGPAPLPVYRTFSLLEQLKGRVDVPTVLFYPGDLDGAAGLRFMGVLDAEHNYRPKIF